MISLLNPLGFPSSTRGISCINKNSNERLFIEVDASDSGWGSCAYQMVDRWKGEPADEGRGRQGDTRARKVIEWVSKA